MFHSTASNSTKLSLWLQCPKTKTLDQDDAHLSSSEFNKIVEHSTGITISLQFYLRPLRIWSDYLNYKGDNIERIRLVSLVGYRISLIQSVLLEIIRKDDAIDLEIDSFITLSLFLNNVNNYFTSATITLKHKKRFEFTWHRPPINILQWSIYMVQIVPCSESMYKIYLSWVQPIYVNAICKFGVEEMAPPHGLL